jgi:hypothetical protein
MFVRGIIMARKSKHCNYFFRLSASLGRLWKSQELLSFSNIRFSRLRYMLIFPLAPVFANMQGKLFETDFRLLGIDAMTLMGSAYCIGAGVIFAFSRAQNVTAVARASVLIALSGFIPWIFLPESQASLLFAALFTFGFGGCAACAAFAYTFGLNNTERFFGAAMISFFCMLMELDYGLSFISGLFSKTYLTILVIGTAICLMSYKAGDFSDAYKRPEGKLNTALKLMLFFFVAHKLVEIFYTYLPVASTPAALVSNGLVGILVVGLAFAIQMFAKRSIWHMCNLFFISMVCAYALYFTPEGSLGRELARLFHGFEQMGYIASYYLLGVRIQQAWQFPFIQAQPGDHTSGLSSAVYDSRHTVNLFSGTPALGCNSYNCSSICYIYPAVARLFKESVFFRLVGGFPSCQHVRCPG